MMKMMKKTFDRMKAACCLAAAVCCLASCDEGPEVRYSRNIRSPWKPCR